MTRGFARSAGRAPGCAPVRTSCAFAAVLSALVVAPASHADGAPPDTIPMPRATSISYYYDAIHQSFVRPATRALDPALLVRKLGVGRREAANVDEQGRVRLPSTWWQPRVGYRTVTVHDMLTGAGPGTGPAPGKWSVVRAKTEGVSKGFQIKDANGVRFAIKFDPPASPELTTSADVVVSKLYWAAGYNVPDNTIARFRRDDLVVGAGATYDIAGKKYPITKAFLDDLLRDVPVAADSAYRVVASRFLKGKPLGEWHYEGRRKDDVEDRIPHELRREIRGLWTINSWTQHTDCSARNTIDMYVTDGGRSFVRHHLIDFNGCLGSASVVSQTPRNGHEYLVDYGTVTRSLGTLALPPYRWEHGVDPNLPSVGYFEADTFRPQSWRPFIPNPAFDARTDADVKWGARIVAGFTDELIRAAVEAGDYSDPRAVEYLVKILEERRDKIVARWLGSEVAAGNGESRP